MSLNSKGYSLLELLLVLMIVMTISSSALYMNNRYVEKHTFDLFYNQLKLDFAQMQITAVTEQRYIKLIFVSGGTGYIGQRSHYDPLFKRKLPPGYNLSLQSTLEEVSFHPNGNIEKFGTFAFITPIGTKYVRVFIGKGRMTLEQ